MYSKRQLEEVLCDFWRNHLNVSFTKGWPAPVYIPDYERTVLRANVRGLEQIARVIEAGEGLEVAGIDYPGWDHHAGQGGVQGNQARMLADLAASLAAFYRQLGEHREQTAVLVMTEFGRTAAQNGSNGTDHGHGGGMLLFGGGVKGGKVHGEWRGLAPENLYQGRDLPVTTDFRDVFAEVLRQLFGFKPPRDFFPDHPAKRLRLF